MSVTDTQTDPVPESRAERRRVVWWLLAPSLLVAAAALLTALYYLDRYRGRLTQLGALEYQFVDADLWGLALMALLVLAGWWCSRWIWPRGRGSETVDSWLLALERRAWLVAGLTVAVLALGARLVYHAHPLSLDEYAVVFQARIFAAGKLTAQLPPALLPALVPRPFWGSFFIVAPDTGRVVASYWPGFSLLLAPCTRLGVPWLLNPLLAGGILLLVHRVALKLCTGAARDARAGRLGAGWALLLTLASPAFVLNGMSYYTMNAHLLFNLLFVALLLEPTPRRAFWAGVAGSGALTLQIPFSHIWVALPWIVWLALRRRRLVHCTLLFVGYLPLCLLLGAGWVLVRAGLLTGLTFHGLSSVLDVVRHAIPQGTPPFRPPNLAVLEARGLGLLKLFLWAAPGLPLLAGYGLWVSRRRPQALLLGCSALAVFAAYLFVPLAQGFGWGFRFFHYVWFALPLLAAAFLVSQRGGSAAWTRAVGSMAVLSLVLANGLQCYQAERFIARQLALLPEVPEDQVHGNPRRIVFLEKHDGYQIRDLIQNDPFLRGRELRLASSGFATDSRIVHALWPGATLGARRGESSVWLLGGGSLRGPALGVEHGARDAITQGAEIEGAVVIEQR